MKVAVGSQNPVKAAAARETFGDNIDIIKVSVDPKVSEQPWGREETITGAINRAEQAVQNTEAAYGVGLEGGVTEFDKYPGVFLIMWAAVSDDDRTEIGAGPQLRLPDSVGDRLQEGEELGPILDDLHGRNDIAQEEGAAGLLTQKKITRASALHHALASALGPFVGPYSGQ